MSFTQLYDLYCSFMHGTSRLRHTDLITPIREYSKQTGIAAEAVVSRLASLYSYL